MIGHGVDPVNIVTKLRRLGPVELLSIGPAQEVTKEEPKQHEEKYFNVINSKVVRRPHDFTTRSVQALVGVICDLCDLCCVM